MFVALVGLATFAVIEYMKVGSLTAELNFLKAPRTARQTPRAEPGQRIVCPLCHGEGRVVYNLSNNPLYKKTQTCPVCRGIGYRMLTIPSGMKICPDCQGMGKVYVGSQTFTAGNCARCHATGLVADVK
jgi:RecJ-like exonuclease